MVMVDNADDEHHAQIQQAHDCGCDTVLHNDDGNLAGGPRKVKHAELQPGCLQCTHSDLCADQHQGGHQSHARVFHDSHGAEGHFEHSAETGARDIEIFVKRPEDAGRAD